MSSIEIDDAEKICESGCNATIHHESRIILGPAAEITKINKRLNATRVEGKGFHKMPENADWANLPDVLLKFGTYNLTLKPEDYIVEYMSVSNPLL